MVEKIYQGNALREMPSEKKGKRTKFVTGLTLLALTSGLFFTLHEHNKQRREEYLTQLHQTSENYTIQNGDRMWNIASNIATKYEDLTTQQVLADIRGLNKGKEIGKIKPGQKFIIPDYSNIK